MNIRFDNKLVVITGAAQGVGATTAMRFASSGASVVALDVNENVMSLAHERNIESLIHDVTSPAAWSRLGEFIQSKYGRLDGIVNNAAIEGICRVEELSLEQFNNTLSVNLSGTFLGCQFAIQQMRQNPNNLPGNIVNIASIAHRQSIANDVAYTASKGGVVSLSRAIAHYCALEGLPVRCNTISPGAIETEMLKQFVENSSDSDSTRRALMAMQPVGHLATPENIADAILYLASDRSGFITGENLVIDGGASTSARI